ncbi:hypothetical protein [Aneurinibacillus migulanus]|uniref:hypothetical protein n=1 Tax=Aneurinibacillus migulanus TaxID=47500 RepID=UPI0009BD7B7C
MTCQFLKDFTDQHARSQRHVTFPTRARLDDFTEQSRVALGLGDPIKIILFKERKEMLAQVPAINGYPQPELNGFTQHEQHLPG